MRRVPSLCLALALATAPVLACEHLPRDYDGTLEQTGQEAIVFWNAGRELLVLKNDFRIEPGPSGQLPAELAWVLPVPSVPDRYAVEDVEVFRAMFEAWEEAHAESMKGARSAPGEDGPRKSDDLELLEKVTAGEYEIQPIRARGAEGAEALRRWLGTNGFGEVPARNLAWYVEHEWVWLAVKVSLSRGEGSLVRNGSLRPLSISFAAAEAVYPVLVSAGQGDFEVNLYVVAEERIRDVARQASKYGFDVDGVLEFDLPEPLERIEARAAREGAWKPIESPVVHKLVGRRLAIDSWKDDFRISIAAR